MLQAVLGDFDGCFRYHFAKLSVQELAVLGAQEFRGRSAYEAEEDVRTIC